jgi:uncharacterized protein YuzE
MTKLYTTYDEEADVLYVQLRERAGQGHSKDFGGDRYVEYDTEGVLAVEFLGASRGIDLEGIPHAAEIARGLAALGALLGRDIPATA